MYRPSSTTNAFGTVVSPTPQGFKPKRYALAYNPPTIILEYGDDTLGLLRTRKFRLKKIATDTNLEGTANEIIRTFPSRIDRAFVSKAQILRLLEVLKRKIVRRNQTLMAETDLNKYNTDDLNEIKEQMNETFVKHELRPGDEGYAYDVQVDFGAPTEANEWDSTDDEADLPLP